MKKHWAVVICILMVIAGCKDGGSSKPSLGAGADGAGADGSIPEAGEEDYTADEYLAVFKAWEEFENAFTDADKTGQGDDNMCWAAVAANMITWSGWAADEDDVFEIFKSHFENKPGYLYNAINYYFDEYIDTVHASTVTIRETRPHLMMDLIVSALHEANSVAIKINIPGRKIGHYLTLFGYRYYAHEDSFLLYYTDSDDYWHQVRITKMEWDDEAGKWRSHSDWLLEYVISMSRN